MAERETVEPDYRFTLANERTYLAWVRTTLALVAGAVAVVQLVPPFTIVGADVVLGVALALIALATSVLSYQRWRLNDRAIRRSDPLPLPRGIVWLTAAIATVVGAIAVLLVLELA